MALRPLLAAVTVAAALAPIAAVAQFQSDGYKFLSAIRDSKGDDVIAALNKPGNTIVNTRDGSTGETALHIVARRGDAPYVAFLLSRGADPNARDNKGNTALIDAVAGGYDNLVQPLIDGHASPNLANSSGETPLILAVHRRDIDMVRILLNDGADPDQQDVIAGKSARDYAALDTRSTAIAKLIGETPKKPKRSVAGPKL